MNEQALQDAYNLFVSEGYTKSIEDFKQLLNTNPDALNDAYGLFVKEGYTKSVDDFSVLLGVSGAAADPVKKKESTDSQLESGGSELSSDLSTEQPPVIMEDTTIDIEQAPALEFQPFDDLQLEQTQQKLKDERVKESTELQKAKTVAQEEEALFKAKRAEALSDPQLNEAIQSTLSDQMKMDEEDAVEHFTKLYSPFGFSFSQTGMGDAIVALAPDGTTETIDLQTLFSNKNEAAKLRDFVKSKAQPQKDREVNVIDREADIFFRDKGVDYRLYKEKRDRWDEVREKIAFIESIPKNQSKLTKGENTKYKDLYIDGKLRSDYGDIKNKLEEESDGLMEYLQDSEVLRASNDFDLHLEDQFQKEANEAVEISKDIASDVRDINQRSLDTFGLPAKDLGKAVPKNEAEKKALDELTAAYGMAREEVKLAADKYEVAKTYLDAKVDKNLRGEFVENYAAVKNATKIGMANGRISDQLLMVLLGLDDVDSESSTKEVAESIVKNLAAQNTGKMGRAEYNYHRAKGFKEKWDIFKDNPAELATALAAQSITQLLPMGSKIIPTTVAGGAAIGLTGGPLAEVTVPAGLAKGLAAGMALTSGALEYTNSVLEAVTNQGYEVTDPESLAKALQDQDVWDEGREIGLKRGLSIAVIDYFSAGLAGRVFKSGKLATRGEKLLRGTSERLVFDTASEGFGEFAAQIVSGQGVNADEIMSEMIGSVGAKAPNAAVNTYMDSRSIDNQKIAEEFTDETTLAKSGISDRRISTWSTNMEKLGKITPETNQKIQKNIGVRREARDLLSADRDTPNFTPHKDPRVEGRLMQLLKRKEELTSTPERRSAYAEQITAIKKEISEIVTTKKLSEDAVQIRETTQVDVGEQTRDGEEVGVGVEGEVTETEKETTSEVETKEEDSTEEVLTSEQKEGLDEEIKDLEAFLKTNNPQFQLETGLDDTQRKEELTKEAVKQLEGAEKDGSIESLTFEVPKMEGQPINVTDNKEIADRTGRVPLKSLEGKKINLVMADQLVTDEKNMGGPLFPLQDGIKDKAAWASINKVAASSIVNGAINSDHTVVYNMGEGAIDSNVALRNELATKMKELGKSDEIFTEIKEQLTGKKYGKNTEVVAEIVKEANTIDELIEGMESLDVDTKAKITRDILPTKKNKATKGVKKTLQDLGINIEDLRSNISESFTEGLPPGAMTMVLQVTDKQGNPVTKETAKEAIITPEEQDAEGIPRHPNYPYYIRGKAIGLLDKTVPFWNMINNVRSTIDAKISGAVRKKTKKYSAAEARANAIRSADMSANRSRKVSEPTKTKYAQFVDLVSRSFPNVEVITNQAEFDALANNLTAKKLTTKNQKVYGAVYQGKLYLNPKLENFNTPIHEFGHMWMNVAKEANPELYDKGLSLIEGSEYVQQIEDSKEYQKIVKDMSANGATETEIRDYILEEALATAIGDKGESFVNAAQSKDFKNWLNKLFSWVKSMVGLSKYSSEQLQDITLDKFLEGVVVDLLSGNEVFVDAQVKTFGDTLQLMTGRVIDESDMPQIISVGRQQGYSDAAIKKILLGRGYKAKEINKAMEVVLDRTLFGDVVVPQEFGKMEGGMKEGIKLFESIKKRLANFTKVEDGATKKSMGEVRAKMQELLRVSPAFKKQPEQTQMELIVALDRTIKTRANKEITKEIGAIKKELKARKVGAKNLQDAKVRLRNFIRKALPKSAVGYNQATVNRLVSRIGKADVDSFLSDVEYVMKEVNTIRDKMKTNQIHKIKALVKRAAKKRKTGSKRVKSKGLSYESQAYFEELLDVLDMILKGDINSLTDLQNTLNKESATIVDLIGKDPATLTKAEAKLLYQHSAYINFFDIENMDLEGVIAMRQNLEAEAKEGRALHQRRQSAWAEQVDVLREEIDETIKKDYPEVIDEDGMALDQNQLRAKKEELRQLFKEKKYWTWVKEYLDTFELTDLSATIENFTNAFKHLGTLTNRLDRTGKFFTENVYNRLNRAEEKYLSGVRRTAEKVDEIANSIDGVENGIKDINKLIFDNEKITIKARKKDAKTPYNTTIGKDEAMRLYALYKDPVQRKKLNSQNIDDKTMEQIEEFLGLQLTEFADKIVDFLSDEYYNEVNSVYRQTNDVNLGFIEQYFPTQAIHSERITDKTNFAAAFSSEYAPSLKERKDLRTDIDLTPGFSAVLETHLDSMERYKAYAVPTKMLQGIFNDPYVKGLLSALHLQEPVLNAVRYAISPVSTGQKYLKSVSRLQGAFTAYALGLKLMQIPKQATSFVNAFEDYKFRKGKNTPVLDHIMFMVDSAVLYSNLLAELGVMAFEKVTNKETGFKGPLHEAMEMSESFKNRLKKGFEGDLVGLEGGQPTYRSLKNKHTTAAKVKKTLKSVLGSPTIIGDIGGVLGYMVNHRRNIKNGMPKAKAIEAFNNYNATQQTRRPTEKTPLQMEGNPIVRLFTMFGSTLFLQMNKVAQAYTNIIRDPKKATTKDIRAMYINLGVANVLFIGMSNIFKLTQGDDEDKEAVMTEMAKAMAGLNQLYKVPILGSGAKEIENMITGNKGKSSSSVDPIAQLIRKYQAAVKYGGEDEILAAAKILGEMALGAQVDPVIGLANAFAGDFDEETMYDILGVSYSYRPSSKSGSKKSGGRSSSRGSRSGGRDSGR